MSVDPHFAMHASEGDYLARSCEYRSAIAAYTKVPILSWPRVLNASRRR